MKAQASIISNEQLKMKEIVQAAIYRHFGWVRRGAGWVKGPNGRNIPSPINALRIKPYDLFKRKHLGTLLSINFFDTIDTTKPHEGNQQYTNLPADKFYVAAGLQLEQAVGTSGADVATLDFGSMTQAELETALVTLEINNKKILEDQPLKQMLSNEDAVPNYFRFPEMVVLEPNNRAKLTLTIKTAVNDFWAHVAFKGFLLEA